MRSLSSVIAALACIGLFVSGAIAQGERAKPSAPPPIKETPRPVSLDDLFTRLSAAKDEREANGVASLIERRWLRSASDTADLLMSRSGDAIRAKDYPLAIELLDRVIALEPQWAEAWNRRATAFFLLDDPASSMADIRQVLAREPRHFGAWAGLGQIYLSTGDKKRALEAFRRALTIHPHLETIRTAVERLAPEIDGRDL